MCVCVCVCVCGVYGDGMGVDERMNTYMCVCVFKCRYKNNIFLKIIDGQIEKTSLFISFLKTKIH